MAIRAWVVIVNAIGPKNLDQAEKELTAALTRVEGVGGVQVVPYLKASELMEKLAAEGTDDGN
jgi:hypothetical protein